MIDINNINKNIFNKYNIFMVAFVFHMLFIFQGMDVTDAGFQLTNQVLAFSLPIQFFSINSFFILTDIVGGFWLSLFGEPNLIWARLGGVLIIALNAAIIFSILSDHFERKRVFLVVLVSTLFLTMRPGLYIIDYFTFPALLINIEFWILNKILLEGGENDFYNFTLGFMVVPIVLSRIPLILIVLIPITIFFYNLIIGVDIRKYKSSTVTSSLGLFCAILFFGIIFYITGILDIYFAHICSVIAASAAGNTEDIDQAYTLFSLIRSYLTDYRDVAIGTVILCILFYALSLIKSKLGPIYATIVALSLTFGVILFMVYRTIYIEALAYDLLKVTIGIIILVSLTYVVTNDNDKKNKKLKIFLFLGTIVMIINPMGSSDGIIKSFHGMWLILPLTILCGFQLKASTKNKTISSIFSLMNLVLLSLLILTLFFHSTDVFRDNINRFELNTEFSSPGLRGVYSTADRVDVVDSLINEIENLSKKNDSILMGVSIPMFYYLTETRPALGNPWVGLISKNDINSRLKDMEEAGNYPLLFIEQRINTEDRNWPKENTPMIDKFKKKQDYLKNRFVNTHNYTIVWENYAFAIYKRDT